VQTVRRLRGGYAFVLALLCSWCAAHAACPPVCTPAGTTITNIATVNYTVAGSAFSQSTNTASFRVDELISVIVTGPAAPLSVNTPDTNRVLTFTVTNAGNAPEAYNLIANLSPGAPVVDQFDPRPGSAGLLFVDVNNNGQLDIGVDTLVSGPLTINPDSPANPPTRILFVSNMPPGLASGNQGVVTLTAASATPGAVVAGVGVAPGTVLPNGGTPAVGVPGIDAVVGAGRNGPADSGADDSASGAYVVGTVVAVAKTIIAVTAPSGSTTGCNVAVPPAACTTFVPGTVIQYLLTVTLTGAGLAQAVLVTDDIPANTTYVAGSIRFNAAPRSDQVDGDNASCTGCGNAVGTLTVNIGDVTVPAGAPVTHLIDYKVSIN
jgi:uncharacterized repeat protein (TIGR01451 family)